MRGFSKLASVFIVLTIGLSVLSGCGSVKKNDSPEGAISKGDVEKVELLYFHPRIRCLSCNDIEKYAKEVAEKDFEKQMTDGKLEFESLQIEDRANEKLVSELDVGGSSLYMVVTGNGKRIHQPIKDVWLYWDKEGECKEIIKKELSKYL